MKKKKGTQKLMFAFDTYELKYWFFKFLNKEIPLKRRTQKKYKNSGKQSLNVL
jgi:hypothetical protein